MPCHSVSAGTVNITSANWPDCVLWTPWEAMPACYRCVSLWAGPHVLCGASASPNCSWVRQVGRRFQFVARD